MYIMCVCLFSALSRMVGALQISIIIIIIRGCSLSYQSNVCTTTHWCTKPLSGELWMQKLTYPLVRIHSYEKILSLRLETVRA